ncbi:MAG: helix-turn-helix transcriptional regulator [Enterocloster asparagiformis]|nr:helix-turn-helix transcriptional regulator [Enterocloster asparagiformis]
MNQLETGKFIAELRKEKSLTQAQLGDLLGVTNKTISRWENGNYMPDLSVLQALCAVLEVSVNEMLSGKRLDQSDFRQQADANLLLTLSQAKRMKRDYKLIDFLSGTGTGLLISTLISPDSPRRTAVLAVSLIMLALASLRQYRFGRFLQNLLNHPR